MRASVLIAANGVTPWIPVIDDQIDTGISLGGYLSYNGSLTWGVQYGFDNLQYRRAVSGTQTTTTVTINDTGPPTGQNPQLSGAGHGLSVGDSVVVSESGIGVDGVYAVVAVNSLTQYTITVVPSQTATLSPLTKVASIRVFNHATMTALVARASGTIIAPCSAVRAVVSSYVAGNLELQVLQAIR